MPYLISTTQKATSTSKCVVGNFFGRDEAPCAVVSSVDRLLVYSSAPPATRQRAGAAHVDPHALPEDTPEATFARNDWELAAELPLFATILALEHVPILCPDTGVVERSLLFVLTGKDQFLVYALVRNPAGGLSPTTTSSGSSSSSPHNNGIRLMLLFGDIIESSFYQPHYDGALLTAVTTELVLSGHPVQLAAPLASSATPASSSSSVFSNPPMVAVSMFHKTIMLIDIGCCLCKAAQTEDPFENEEQIAARQPSSQKKGNKLRQRANAVASLFSPSFWSQVVEPRKEHAALTVQFLDETTIVDIAFGYATTATSGEYPLYVLHTDARMRNHLVQYHLATSKLVATKPAATTGLNKGAQDAVQLAILGLSFDAERPKFPLKWSRTGALQTDLELEARRVLPIFHGVCVIGVQLVTYIVQQGVSITEAFPSHPDGVGEVNAVVSLDSSGQSALVAFQNGAIRQVTVRQRDMGVVDEDVQVLRRNTTASSHVTPAVSKDTIEVKLSTLTQRCGSTPSSIAVVSRGTSSPACGAAVVVVSSLMGPLLLLDLDPSGQPPVVLLENAGPILRLAVVPDELDPKYDDSSAHGPSTVVASNGVDADGGLYVLRTAVNFQEDTVLPWIEGISNVFLVGETLCFTFSTHTRFLRFVLGGGPSTESLSEAEIHGVSESARSVALEEGEPSQLPLHFESETILLVAYESSRLLQVTRHSYAIGGWGEGAPIASKNNVDRIGHAARHQNYLVVAQGKQLTVLDIGRQFTAMHSVTCDHEISCVHIGGGGLSLSPLVVIYGEWLSNALVVRPLGAQWSSVPVSVSLSSVPRSVVMSSIANGATSTTICCGLSDGSLSFAAIGVDGGNTITVEVIQEAKLSRRPVHLQEIPAGLQGSASAVMCCCDVPAIIYEQDGLIAVTGVALNDMEFASYSQQHTTAAGSRRSGRTSVGTSPVDPAYGSLVAAQQAAFPAMVVASPSEECIRLGGLRSVQKVSRTASHSAGRQTIAAVSYLDHFHAIGAAARSVDRDILMILNPTTGFGRTSLAAKEDALGQLAATTVGGPSAAGLFPLMTNERCTFIESVVIGGPNDKVMMSHTSSRNSFQSPTKAQWVDEGWRAQHGASPFNAILVGTSMIFADETFPRSCRLIWGAVESVPNAEQDGQRAFVQLGDRELSGAATCCSAVPNCPNRIAVGVNGSVHLFRWHAADRTFVVETCLSVGSLLISLTPLFPKDSTMTGLLVVADWKHSVCVVKVNPIDNSLEVCAKDPSLRGVMDIEVTTPSHHPAGDIRVENAPSCVGYEFLFADDMMNIFSAVQEVVDVAQPAAPARRSQSLDDEEDPLEERHTSTTVAGSAAAVEIKKRWTARRRLLTSSQAHLGDRISSLVRGDLAPCASLAAHDAIRGATSDRFLFGTIHGALGVMTPVAPLPFRMYQLLETHIATVAKATMGGGLDYEYFRDVAGHGQLRRPPSDNPSFGERRSKKLRDGDKVPISFATTKFANKGFAHADLVEHFLRMTPAEQMCVLDRVNGDISQDIVFARNGFEEFVTQQPVPKAAANPALGTVLHEVGATVAAPDGRKDEESSEQELQQPSDTAVEEANDGLAKWRLPSYPCQLDSIKQMIKELLRTH